MYDLTWYIGQRNRTGNYPLFPSQPYYMGKIQVSHSQTILKHKNPPLFPPCDYIDFPFLISAILQPRHPARPPCLDWKTSLLTRSSNLAPCCNSTFASSLTYSWLCRMDGWLWLPLHRWLLVVPNGFLFPSLHF